MALFSECSLQCARKVLDTADIVREAIFRQLTLGSDLETARHDLHVYHNARYASCLFIVAPTHLAGLAL
jgi:hypothetical protein